MHAARARNNQSSSIQPARHSFSCQVDLNSPTMSQSRVLIATSELVAANSSLDNKCPNGPNQDVQMYVNLSTFWYCFLALITTLGLLVSLVSNMIIIYLFSRTPSLRRNPSNIIAVNLSLSDLLYCIQWPLVIYCSITQSTQILEIGFVCQTFGFITVCTAASSICTVLAMSVERAIVIRHSIHPKNRFTIRGAWLIVVLIWIVSICSSLPPLFGKFNRYTLDPSKTSCTLDYLSRKTNYKLYILVLYFAYWISPTVIISICYILIIVTFRRSSSTLSAAVNAEDRKGAAAGRFCKQVNQNPAKRCKRQISALGLVHNSAPVALFASTQTSSVCRRTLIGALNKSWRKVAGKDASDADDADKVRQVCGKETPKPKLNLSKSRSLDAAAVFELDSIAGSAAARASRFSFRTARSAARGGFARVDSSGGGELVCQCTRPSASVAPPHRCQSPGGTSTVVGGNEDDLGDDALSLTRRCLQQRRRQRRVVAELSCSSLIESNLNLAGADAFDCCRVGRLAEEVPPPPQAPPLCGERPDGQAAASSGEVAGGEPSPDCSVRRNRQSECQLARSASPAASPSCQVEAAAPSRRLKLTKSASMRLFRGDSVAPIKAASGPNKSEQPFRCDTAAAATSQSQVRQPTSATISDSWRLSRAANLQASRANMQFRLAKMSFYLILLWLISWTPIASLGMINSVLSCHRASSTGVFIANTMTKLGPAFDVFIYGISHPKIKSKFRKIIMRFFVRRTASTATLRTTNSDESRFQVTRANQLSINRRQTSLRNS